MEGIKQEIDEDLFEQMSEELHRPKTQNSRWKPDGTYNKRPLDPDYFKNYFKQISKLLPSAQTVEKQ